MVFFLYVKNTKQSKESKKGGVWKVVLQAGLEPARCLQQGIFLLLYVTIAVQ